MPATRGPDVILAAATGSGGMIGKLGTFSATLVELMLVLEMLLEAIEVP